MYERRFHNIVMNTPNQTKCCELCVGYYGNWGRKIAYCKDKNCHCHRKQALDELSEFGEKFGPYTAMPHTQQERWEEQPYNETDHSHCWQSKKPPCGQRIEHLKCCLCEIRNPKVRSLLTEQKKAFVEMVEEMMKKGNLGTPGINYNTALTHILKLN